VATVLGLGAFIVFIACVIGLAAGATYLVVKISPVPGAKSKPNPTE
jgi:archaellin